MLSYYARLYGLPRDELRYTPCGADPKEVRFHWRNIPRAEVEGDPFV